MRMWSTILITNTWRDLPLGLLQCSWTNYGSIFHWISYPFQEISIKYDVVFVAIDRLGSVYLEISEWVVKLKFSMADYPEMEDRDCESINGPALTGLCYLSHG